MAAFSSIPSPLSVSFDEVDLRGVEDSPSAERRCVTSGRLNADFSDTWTRGGGEGGGASLAWCFSAMADTAASTLTSNSSSEIVKEVRSKFSINCTAPIYNLISILNYELDKLFLAYQ
jgi:hypothetical protein